MNKIQINFCKTNTLLNFRSQEYCGFANKKWSENLAITNILLVYHNFATLNFVRRNVFKALAIKKRHYF